MTIKGVAAERLIAAWHGPATAAELARQFKLKSAQMVRKFWGKAKKAGKLPEGKRPHFADRGFVAPDVFAHEEADDSASLDDAAFDAVIAKGEAERRAQNILASNASLAALIAAHPDMNDPKFHHYATAPRSHGGRA